MTDLTKLSVAELRQDFAALSITHPHFKWALGAFDELARRLEEAQGAIKEVSEEDKGLRELCENAVALKEDTYGFPGG